MSLFLPLGRDENRTKHPNSTRSKFTILRQLCQLIPSHMVSKLARKHEVHKKARTFSPWSHVVSMLYAQLIHAIGLNDVCDNLRLISGICGVTPIRHVKLPDST